MRKKNQAAKTSSPIAFVRLWRRRISVLKIKIYGSVGRKLMVIAREKGNNNCLDLSMT
jgi:hypothetical protein